MADIRRGRVDIEVGNRFHPADVGPGASNSEEADISKLDIRVGKIVDVDAHPDADTLYVEQIDVGEAEGPRTIVSGLRKYISLEELKGQNVLILANLKPRNMRGIKSNGMVLCASNDEHTVVEPLRAPEGATMGERVFFGDEGSQQGDPAAPNQLQKKKYWESCQPCLKTDANCVANFNGKIMLTSAGPVTSKTLKNANIS